MEKTAFIAIVGRPNVGKSSILNEMIGQKVAIVSSKPQTTRTRIMGILTEDDTQLVFIDTPGLHKPVNELGKYMVRSVNESVNGVDACLLVVEAGKPISHADEDLINKFKSLGLPAILAINKIDLIRDKTEIMQQILNYTQKFNFSAIVPVCAKNGSAIDELKDELKKLANEGNYFFDEDELTDQPEKVLASEMVREKLLRLLGKEIPHGIAVVIERMRNRDDSDILDVEATIFCEKATHKGIIIGKGGSMLKKIGTYARQDMEAFFQCRVNLNLWVKVKEDWRNRERMLQSFGFDNNDFL